MWDTTGFTLKPVAGPTTPYGCPTFAPAYVGRKRWAKPTAVFCSGLSLFHFEAQWRDLRFRGTFLGMFYYRSRSEMLHSL